MANEREPSGRVDGLPYRARAREHFAAARESLAVGGPHPALAACLFLRMAIEALAYELLETYQSEVDFAAMRMWQPGKLIKEPVEIDGAADRTVTLTAFDGDGREILSGTERRLAAGWIARSHNALGSFLHEPTIRQVEDGRAPEEAAIRAKAEAIATEVGGARVDDAKGQHRAVRRAGVRLRLPHPPPNGGIETGREYSVRGVRAPLVVEAERRGEARRVPGSVDDVSLREVPERHRSDALRRGTQRAGAVRLRRRVRFRARLPPLPDRGDDGHGRL